MVKFWKTQKFKALQKLYYDKLATSGFKDAKEEFGDEQILKQQSSNAYRQASEVTRESKQQYFELLSRNTQLERFDDPIDRFILLKRSEGKTIAEIAKGIKQIRKDIKCPHRNTIVFKIRRYEHQWGIRVWTRKQMGYKDKLPIK